MALQFQPPPDWLLKGYLDNKDRNPAVDTMNAILPTAQLYIQRKQQEESRQQAALGNYIKAFEAGGPVFAGDIAKRTGLQDPPALPSQSSPKNPSEMPNIPMDENNIPITGPVQGPLNKIQGPSGYVPKGAGPNAIPAGQMQDEAKFRTPIIDHWSSSSSGQSQNPSSQESPEDLLGLGAYGNKQLQARKLIKDLETDPNAPIPTMTPTAALAAGQIPPRTKVIDPPSNKDETRQERLSGSFRKELTGSKPYERFSTMKAASENIENAAKDPGAYGDLATLFDYMKALDPTSVVREGEQETFRKTGSFTQSMANTMNKLVSGQTITPEQRSEIVKYTKSRLKTAHGIYKSHAEPTLRQAKRMGIDPLEVDPYYDYKIDEGASSPSGQKIGRFIVEVQP